MGIAFGLFGRHVCRCAEHRPVRVHEEDVDRAAVGDAAVVVAGGADRSRAELANELVIGRDRLAGKKLVVVQFAARELSVGDWRVINLPAVREGG